MSVKYGDPSRLRGVVFGYEDTYFTNDIVIERFLVQSGPPSIESRMFNVVLDAAPTAVAQDFDEFEMVGVTICPLQPGETVSGVPILEGSNSYIVDLVYRLTTWEVAYISATDHEVAFQGALASGGFNRLGSRPTTKLLALTRVTADNFPDAAMFWSTKPGLSVVRKGQQASRTEAWQRGWEAKTWGRQLAFGLADYPGTLEDVSTPALVTPVPGGGGPTPTTPLFTWPGGKTVQAPSTNNLLVWGVFAAGGFLLAREAWRALRG